MLRRRVHFPLGMVESHVAGLAGLRRAGFFGGESVTGMARIALRRSEFGACAVLAEFGHLRQSLIPDLVASAATLLALSHGHGLPVNGRHGLHRRPRHGVFALPELCDLRLVALGASFRRGDLHFRHVACRCVLVAVTSHARNLDSAVLAELPIGDDVGRDFAVAVDALRRSSGLRGDGASRQNRKKKAHTK